MIDGQINNKQSRRNVVQEKSFDFALEIIRLSRRLQSDRTGSLLSRQLVRSGTSIGANIEEAIAAQSKKDFLAKMHIAMKEARETHYWLRLICKSGLTTTPEIDALLRHCAELVTILGAITLTTRRNLTLNKSLSSSDYDNSSFHIPHSQLGARRRP
jgi:four helix bundle protein